MRKQKVSIRDLSFIHKAAIDAMKDQLLIVLFNRLGGTCDIPVAEVDETGKYALCFRIDQGTRVFHFEVVEKDTGK